MNLFKNILCGLLFVSCGQPITQNQEQDQHNHWKDCWPLEEEPNDDIRKATFVSVFNPPQNIKFCGQFDDNYDPDWYHFFTLRDQLTSLVISNDDDMPIEAFLMSYDLENDHISQLGHWVGNPGELVLLNFPTYVTDNGFHLMLTSPTHMLTRYNVEIWSTGIIE